MFTASEDRIQVAHFSYQKAFIKTLTAAVISVGASYSTVTARQQGRTSSQSARQAQQILPPSEEVLLVNQAKDNGFFWISYSA
jgi:hypothetical protein